MAGKEQYPITACAAMEPDLVLYYYCEISGSQRSAVEEHTRVCAACRGYLDEIRTILPLTVQRDEPGQMFWQQYSRDMRSKLADAEGSSWWRRLTGSLQSWTIPAAAAAAVAVVALGFTLTQGVFRSNDIQPDDANLMEMLPVAENLEFFSNMEILDSMDLLEVLGGQGNAQS